MRKSWWLRSRAVMMICVLVGAIAPASAASSGGASGQSGSGASGAPAIDGHWTVRRHVGEKHLLNPESVLGKGQSFRGDWAKGSFFDCVYGGLSKSHTRYALEDFLRNPEFRDFARYREELAFTETAVHVHRVSCARGLRILYPFVTFEPSGRAMLLFEGLILVFE